MKKITLIGGVVVVAIVIFAVVVLVSNLNAIVAGVIEKSGSEVTETSVGVSGVDISIKDGRGTIKGLRVGSPDGFKTNDAFSLADITVDIDVGSVREDPIVIDEITIKAPVVNVELTAKGASNIDELRKRVQAYTGGSGDSDEGKPKNIRIKKFVFEEGSVNVDASALGLEKRTLILPAIRLTNVGGNSGSPPDEITKQILTTVTKNVTKEIAGSEIDRLVKEQLGDESLQDKAKSLLKKITD